MTNNKIQRSNKTQKSKNNKNKNNNKNHNKNHNNSHNNNKSNKNNKIKMRISVMKIGNRVMIGKMVMQERINKRGINQMNKMMIIIKGKKMKQTNKQGKLEIQMRNQNKHNLIVKPKWKRQSRI